MNLRSATFTASLLCLVGCDSLHGVQIGLTTENAQPMPANCVAEGLRKAGLELVSTGSSSANVREIGGRGSWFGVTFEKPEKINFYVFAMHEPVPCKHLQSILPRLRAAVVFTQESCSLPGHPIKVTENWSQSSCGL